MNEYDDIIDLPHHQSTKHKHMSNYQRAAQFAPFAALTGYDASIDEMALLTDQKLVLSDEQAKSVILVGTEDNESVWGNIFEDAKRVISLLMYSVYQFFKVYTIYFTHLSRIQS